MNLYKISVITTTEGSELVGDILLQISSGGVSVEDKADLGELYKGNFIWDYIDDEALTRSDDVTVTGYSDDENAVEFVQNRLKILREASNMQLGSLKIICAKADGGNWEDNWKDCYKRIDVGNVSVLPDWIDSDSCGKIIVRIIPGMAFGTGEHETTRLCLDMLQRIKVEGKILFDIGCGSGILGMAGLLMGAKHCTFRDIDETALRNMSENLKLNSLTGRSSVECASLMQGIEGKADVIIANITADILIKMAKDASEHLNSGGQLILSGIIDKYESKVVDCYSEYGFTVTDKANDGCWCALTMVQK